MNGARIAFTRAVNARRTAAGPPPGVWWDAGPANMPLAEYLTEIWLPAIADTIRPATLAIRTSLTRHQIARRPVGSIALCDLSPRDLNALYAELARCSDPACRHDGSCRGQAAATRVNVHYMLHRALRHAVEWGLVEHNVAAYANPPRIEPGALPDVWTVEQLRWFLRWVGPDRLFALYRLAATTGMRRSELCGLAWRSVDLTRGCIRVERQLLSVSRREGATFGPPKTPRGSRAIMLDDGTTGALWEHRTAQEREQRAATRPYNELGLVFCTRKGDPLSPVKLSFHTTELRKEARLPFGTLMTIRHTVATLALTAMPPVPVHVLARRLGHHPETLLSRYAHLLPTSDASAADAIADQLHDERSRALSPRPRPGRRWPRNRRTLPRDMAPTAE